jgi:hypothetical protein
MKLCERASRTHPPARGRSRQWRSPLPVSPMLRRRFSALLALAPWAAGAGATPEAGPADLRWTDPARNRELPLRIRWPAGEGPCALAVFSHGLGGNLQAGTLWAEAWQAAGLAVLNLQHPGSDDSIWKGGRRGVQQGAQVDQYLARAADARFVLDEIERRRDEPGWRRVRLDAIGFSGHSFGARLTQAIAGETLPGRSGVSGRGPLADPRPRAFIAFSPGFSARGGDLREAARQHFAGIDRPFLCLTGTRDDAMIAGDATNEARRVVYDGLPAGARAELVLDGADHMTFGGQARAFAAWPARRPNTATEREVVHRALVVSVSTDWWRWRLLGDTAAADRLRRPAGLAEGDGWRIG